MWFPTLLALAALFAQETVQDTPHGVRKPLPSAEVIAKLPADGGPEFNRLIFEASPYLRQHARNPVDWWPWGPEAFAEAARRDLPVFLSVGYSTCHWCHVMEHESFEDEAVAKLMNEHFICVKVDREERPDLDHVYMTVTQGLTERGGWPMSVLMTAEAKPFWADTYLPKESRFGRIGMLDFVPQMGENWKNNRKAILDRATQITDWVSERASTSPGAWRGPEVLRTAEDHLAQRYDKKHGGFGQTPKFPVPHQLLFLLTRHTRTGDDAPLDMALHTLDQMRLGGMWDHVGYGFHRYSTDERWFLPHFEKMLYDQALHTMAYVAGWQLTGDASYRRTAEEIIRYVLRDMTAPQGGFYSAEDADSEGEEGLFYLWSPAEARELLGEEDGQWFTDRFGLTDEGNFLEEASRERTGRSIPFLATPLDAKERERFDRIRQVLFDVREKRIHPFKDDKVLVDWNGLMIVALARAANAFGEPAYADAAKRAADFLLEHCRDEKGRLFKRWRGGQAGLTGTLEDYAFLAWGLSELYEAVLDPRYLAESKNLCDTMIAHFHDDKDGAFFITADDGLDLIVRAKQVYDGAIPSGNSVAALVLLRLSKITGDTEYADLSEEIMTSFAGGVAASPSAYSQLLAAVDVAEGPSFEIVVAGDLADSATAELLEAARTPFLPSRVLLHRPLEAEAAVATLAPWTKAQAALEGKATVYVCRDWTCELPVHTADALSKKLDPTNPNAH